MVRIRLSVIAVTSVLNAFSAFANPPTDDISHHFSATSELSSKAPVPESEWNISNRMAREWLRVTKGNSVLEGASIERDGSLIFTDSVNGLVMRLNSAKKLDVIHKFNDEGPGGTAIDKNGRIFVALLSDKFSKGRIISMNQDGSDVRDVLPESKGFVPNDLVFDRHGGFYFSDFRGTSTNPAGGAYYVSADFTQITPVLKNISLANGIALSPDGSTLWVTEYGANKLHRVDLVSPVKAGVLGTSIPYYFSGPGPDSMRVDSKGNVYVAMMGQGRVLVLASNGIPVGQILLPDRNKGQNLISASLALSPDSQDMYIVAGDLKGGNGAAVYHAKSYANGLRLLSHQ